MKITFKAMAKINLFLNIIGVLENGYHTLDMIMQSINLYDTVVMNSNDSGKITISCDQTEIPCDENNIAYQAATAFFRYIGKSAGIHIHIEKRIPHQAGLGGGSADGAAVLVGLNQLLHCGLSAETLCNIGVIVGADIPFCIQGGTCLVQGIGEKLTPITNLTPCHIVLVKPEFGISTKEAYESFDRGMSKTNADYNSMIQAINKRDLHTLSGLLFNALESAATDSFIPKIKQQMLHQGALGALMSGSGSAVFGIFEDEETANKCKNSFEQQYESVFITNPMCKGIY